MTRSQFVVPRIKVCGLTHHEDLAVARDAGADAVGIVRASGSPRDLPLEVARALLAHRGGDAPIGVLVTTESDARTVLAEARAIGAQMVQLAGPADPLDFAEYPVGVLRSVAVSDAGLRGSSAWEGVADALVLDHPSAPGGSGLAVDLDLARAACARTRCLLAGGLDAGNVAARLAATGAYGVDASSRLESAPGRKEPARVTAFVHAARGSLGLGQHPPQVRGPMTFQLPTRFGGIYGGAFAPETLMPALIELERSWIAARMDTGFQAELARLLADYAGRPTPLYHARRTSEALGFELWLKREDLLHTGAHKLNNALGQCLLAARAGKRRVIAETGAGQHGVATATAAALLGLDCTVYMGALDAARQAPNVQRMRLLGARLALVEAGSATLKDAVNEALRAWTADPSGSHYVLGSALGPHPFPTIVADLQSVIGREAREQVLVRAGALPDVVVACVGGGSNAIGLFRAFLDDAVDLIGVEAGGQGVAGHRHAARFAAVTHTAAGARAGGGRDGVLHGAFTRVLQDESGLVRETHSISAGLDYPAVGPEHAALAASGRARYTSAEDSEALTAFERLARLEGILPALESSHALAWIASQRDVLAGKRVLVGLSGRGDKDLDTVLAERVVAPAVRR